MTEDELLEGIGQALTLAGWRWTHIRRSDAATMQGNPGLPDIIAAHTMRAYVLAWELKTETGNVTPDQLAWLMALRWGHVDARIIRPADYDNALTVIIRDIDPAEVFGPVHRSHHGTRA